MTQKNKVILGAVLIGLSAFPLVYTSAYIILRGGLPIAQNAPGVCGGVGCQMNLGLSLSYFILPFSFFMAGIGSWILYAGLTERSLISGKRESRSVNQ